MLSSLILAFLLFAGEQGGRLVFEKNNGQAPADIRYLLKTENYELQFKRGEMVFHFRDRALRIQFKGQLNQLIPEGRPRLDRLVRNINSTDHGPAPAIPTFGSVKYESLYPGIDLACYSRSGKLECDFVALPGSDPGRILVEVEGADSIAIDEAGELNIEIAGQAIRIRKPNAYQVFRGQRNVIDVRYSLTDKSEVGFVTSEYNRAVPLIIDPR